MTFRLSKRSLVRLEGVHPDLVAVVHAAMARTRVDFMITEGRRSLARQKELVAAGASRTMNSRHLTGRAVDVAALVGGEVRWDWPLYGVVAEAFKAAAVDLKTTIIWGGDWPKFRDGPHFELARKAYP